MIEKIKKALKKMKNDSLFKIAASYEGAGIRDVMAEMTYRIFLPNNNDACGRKSEILAVLLGTYNKHFPLSPKLKDVLESYLRDRTPEPFREQLDNILTSGDKEKLSTFICTNEAWYNDEIQNN